jgi:hypothetical protein
MREPKYNRLVFRGTVLETMDNDVILLFKDYPDNCTSPPSGVEAKYLQVASPLMGRHPEIGKHLFDQI